MYHKYAIKCDGWNIGHYILVDEKTGEKLFKGTFAEVNEMKKKISSNGPLNRRAE